MTKLLDQAIAQIRKLPEADQDVAAEILLAIGSKHDRPVPLDDETREAIREGLAEADRGEFVSEEDMEAFFARHRA